MSSMNTNYMKKKCLRLRDHSSISMSWAGMSPALVCLLGAITIPSGCSKEGRTLERNAAEPDRISPTETRAAEIGAPGSKFELTKADPKPPPSNSELCVGICKHTVSLGCNSNDAECRDTCEQMLQVDTCGGEMARVFACMARQPTAAFECGEDRIAALLDGYCDAEQSSFARCIQSAAVPPQ